MHVEGMATNWTKWAEEDPLWAILTDPEKKGGRWDVQEFFESGKTTVGNDMAWVKKQNITMGFQKALDFGCGVGRLTQALASHFEEAHGVDVSPAMIKLAEEFANQRNSKVRFYCNQQTGLGIFEDNSYDFVYSHITLQHIPTRHQRSYLRDFLRVLKPDGVALFQVMRTHGWRRLVPDVLVEVYRTMKHGGNAFIPMYGISPEVIASIVREAGCKLVEHHSFAALGCENRFLGDVYCVTKGPEHRDATS